MAHVTVSHFKPHVRDEPQCHGSLQIFRVQDSKLIYTANNVIITIVCVSE